MKTLVALAFALLPTASTFVVRSKSIRGETALALSAKGLFRTMGVLPAAVTLTEQYAPQAVSLMGNMRTPASILAGSLIGLAVSSPLPIKTPAGKVESRFEKSLRLTYTVVGVMSMLSQLVSIMWATVAVNQLIERNIAPAASVWALLKRDFDLEWAAVNAHFVLGMFGFCFLIGTRAFFQAGGGLMGQSVAGLAISGLLLMVSIVNRGVAAGGGKGSGYGATVFSLIGHYVFLLTKRATTVGSMGPLEFSSIAIFTLSIAIAVRGIAKESRKDEPP